MRYGLPVEIITDNGPQFCAEEFKGFLSSCGVKHVTTPRYHPQANEGVERFNRVIKNGLRTHRADGKSIADALAATLFHYRVTPHSLTGKSPGELFLGRKIREPLSQFLPASSLRSQAASESLRATVEAKQQSDKVVADRSRSSRSSSFEVCHFVRVSRARRQGKLRPVLSTARKILQKIGADTCNPSRSLTIPWCSLTLSLFLSRLLPTRQPLYLQPNVAAVTSYITHTHTYILY